MSQQPQFGKGSKRRTEDFKKVQENWDSINWNSDLIVCCECGQPRKKKDIDKMERLKDGSYRCLCCNWN